MKLSLEIILQSLHCCTKYCVDIFNLSDCWWRVSFQDASERVPGHVEDVLGESQAKENLTRFCKIALRNVGSRVASDKFN
jgi:hypothetical protein